MINDIAADATNACPLAIESVIWNDPVLNLSGQGWNFSTMNPWRVKNRDGVITSIDDPEAQYHLKNLIGKQVNGFSVAGGVPQIDLLLNLSDSSSLEIWGTSNEENWVLRTPGQPTAVFVP